MGETKISEFQSEINNLQSQINNNKKSDQILSVRMHKLEKDHVKLCNLLIQIQELIKDWRLER